MKILDLSNDDPVEEPSEPSELPPPPHAQEPKLDEVGHHDGDDDDGPPFDFILNETSGIQLEQNGKAHYIANGIEVDRDTYLACVATCGVQGDEIIAIFNRLIDSTQAAVRKAGGL